MEEVGAFEAKNRLSSLLERAEKGEEIVITKHGRPVAKLVPMKLAFDRKKAREAVRGLIKARKGLSLGGLKIKDLINEGRK
jgi:prevent-host-death family protein